MSKLKLEVGKRYLNESGDEVTITSCLLLESKGFDWTHLSFTGFRQVKDETSHRVTINLYTERGFGISGYTRTNGYVDPENLVEEIIDVDPKVEVIG